MNKITFASLALAAVVCVGCEEKAPAPAASTPPVKGPTTKAVAPAVTPPVTTPSTPPVTPPVSPSAPLPAVAGPGTVTVMGLTTKLPEGWKSVVPANAMRLAEVQVPDASGDAAKMCTLVLSTAGGDVASNIARWEGQVTAADGKPSKAEPKTRTVEGMNVTTVELTGSFMNMGETVPHTNWMMRGAVVETPAGLLFLKMTGPAEQMAAAGKGFDAMIDGMKK